MTLVTFVEAQSEHSSVRYSFIPKMNGHAFIRTDFAVYSFASVYNWGQLYEMKISLPTKSKWKSLKLLSNSLKNGENLWRTKAQKICTIHGDAI